MGRYAKGTKGFFCKYVFDTQPTNVIELVAWSAIAQPERNLSLFTQLFLPYDEAHERSMEFVTCVGPLTTCYQVAVPPFDLIDDVESAIYQVADRWQDVIRTIDATLPGTALVPDISSGPSFTFEQADWAPLAQRVGHGADPNDLASLATACDLAFASGDDDYLPYLAARALHHAVANDLSQMELVDAEPRMTNLWEVVDDYAGAFDPGASWEDRALHARLWTFQNDWERAMPVLAQLLDEQPTAIQLLRVLFTGYVNADDWAAIWTAADERLANAQDDVTRGELLRWRGEAAWCLDGMDGARADAVAAKALGRGELQAALDEEAGV